MTLGWIPDENNELTMELRERLLSWLGPDRDQAEVKYAGIRAQLREFFVSKGCGDPEPLIDEAVVRVVKKHRKLAAPGDSFEAIFRKAARKALSVYRKQWAATDVAFERLLKWLNADREKASHEYNRIHQTLTVIFRTKGFDGAENLADEAIRRVIRRLLELEGTYQGAPAKFFSGVAKKICKEQARLAQSSRRIFTEYGKLMDSQHSSVPSEANEDNQERKCFYKCLMQQKAEDRRLLLVYYEKEKTEKIKSRKEMASILGITRGNLRVRRHRAYASLLKCIERCLRGDQ